MDKNTAHPYDRLTPDTLLQAIENAGYHSDGRILALNSYENRVYQIGIEDTSPVIAKFYRPGRWSDDAILEEHVFTCALAEIDIPVVAPLKNEKGQTLFEYQNFRFALYPRRGGRWPSLDTEDNLLWIGRFIGRIHALGAITQFKHRETINVDTFGQRNLDYLSNDDVIPLEYRSHYLDTAQSLLDKMAPFFVLFSEQKEWIRLHGDCHAGNILWTDDHGPHFVDFDDCRNGPVIQDLWMLADTTGLDTPQMALNLIIEGYEEFHPFDYRQLKLIEPLRSLRFIHYSTWLARRWQDPAFPMHFPWFAEPQYWAEQIQLLESQHSKLD
ncbi:MAG: serine/threonine protein kinase [Gammaproteobacteria bacterium]|nr:serine/threonine protein kinase [Gammaproteobacteria bacterium]